jgi:hypothetical protein
MTTIRTRLKVGADGKLIVPVGVDEAGREVSVTVIPVDASDVINGIPREEWHERFDRTEGSIEDESFKRPPQLPQDRIPELDD